MPGQLFNKKFTTFIKEQTKVDIQKALKNKIEEVKKRRTRLTKPT